MTDVEKAREALIATAARTEITYDIMEVARAYALAVHVEVCQILRLTSTDVCGKDGWYCEVGEKYKK